MTYSTPEVHFEDGPANWESENLPCGYPFNVVRYGETTSDPAKVTCAGCLATITEPIADEDNDEVPVDERTCWPICEPCANGRKAECVRLADDEAPKCGHLRGDDCECNGNDQPTAAVVEAAEAARCCDPGPYCEDLPGCVVKAEHAAEPQPERRMVPLRPAADGRLREAAALLRQAKALIEAAYEETPAATSARVLLAGASEDIDQAQYQLRDLVEDGGRA